MPVSLTYPPVDVLNIKNGENIVIYRDGSYITDKIYYSAAKREAYKVILLAVIGSMELPNSPFYDPESYKLLTALGKMFIYDLLEKLDGKIRLIQVNTDGLMLVPKDWSKEKGKAKIKLPV